MSLPGRNEVNRIVVKRRRHDAVPALVAEDPSPDRIITDSKRLDAVLELLHRHSSGWEPVPFTPPAGSVTVGLYDDSTYKAGVVLGGYGSLQGLLSADGGGDYYKDLPDDDLRELFRLLDLDVSRE